MKHHIFANAVVRKPGSNFAEGISTGGLGKPDFEKALQQHELYCRALEACGLNLIVLEDDPDFPDSPFVEDTAVVTEKVAVITRPGDVKRRGEEIAVKDVLSRFRTLEHIEPPGTVDGGDILRIGDHFFTGLSGRTNEEGANQLRSILLRYDYTTSTIEVTESLHLKSDVNYIGKNNIVVTGELADCKEFEGLTKVVVGEHERYAANCLFVNDHLLIPEGYPKIRDTVQSLGYNTIALAMSEFQKMDGGLTCLSIRF